LWRATASPGRAAIDLTYQRHSPRHRHVAASMPISSTWPRSRVAARLPFPQAMHQLLRRHGPQGRVEKIHAGWQGPWRPRRPMRLGAVFVRSRWPIRPRRPKPWRRVNPRRRGARRRCRFRSHAAGRQGHPANEADGALLLPAVFEDPLLPLTRLQK
jgi:hypothetical protein